MYATRFAGEGPFQRDCRFVRGGEDAGEKVRGPHPLVPNMDWDEDPIVANNRVCGGTLSMSRLYYDGCQLRLPIDVGLLVRTNQAIRGGVNRIRSVKGLRKDHFEIVASEVCSLIVGTNARDNVR